VQLRQAATVAAVTAAWPHIALLPCLCCSAQLHDGFTDAYYYVREATLKCVKGHMDHFAKLRAARLTGNASAADDSVSKPMVRRALF
jgi:hypothetical protein